MNKPKMNFQLVRSVFIVLAVCFLFAGCSGDKASDNIMEVRRYEEAEGKPPLTFQNKNLEFQFNQDTTQFSVKNLKTGLTWYSNPPDAESDTLAAGDAKNVLQSTMTVRYTTRSDVSNTIDNYKYSVEGKLYDIKPHLDDSGKEIGVEVRYTIGQVERTYIIPLAVPESRMNEFTENMDDAAMKDIRNYYQVLDINKLKGDQASKYTEQYPDIVDEPIYVLRDTTKEHLRAKLEGIFTNAGYTQEDYKEDLARYDVSTALEKPAFNVTVWYYLDDEDFIVEVPMEEIEYNSTYPIIELSILPYFGAGGLEDEGFVFVPDGNGGLIHFNNGRKNQAAFNNNIYGWDYGVYRDALVEETASSYPLFGVSKNGESFLCISEQGSSYAYIEADISGKLASYNFGKFTYFMLHKEKMDITAKSDTTVQLFEKELPKEHIKQRYRFLDSGDYVDMAVCYRDYLMNIYPTLTKEENADVPAVVEYVGAVDTIEHRLGFPVTEPQALTKYKDAKAMTEELVQGGFKNLSIKYTGWSNEGTRNKNMNKVKTISNLGSKKDFKNLVSYSESQGIDLYLDANFSFVYKDGWFDGFKPNRDVGKRVSRKLSKWYPFYYIWYSPTIERKNSDYYFVQPRYTMKSIDNYTKQIAKMGVNNISFADIGYILGADYNPKKLRTRESVMLEQQSKLDELKSQDKKVMINSDNLYAMPYADYVLGLPVNYSNKNIVDETVPFYSIVFHGLVPYSGSPMNLSQDYETEFLKSIENGTGLYYLFMKEPSLVLQEGHFTKYYAADYSLWKDTAVENYQTFADALNGTYNQYITKHEKISDNVYLTEYENGRRVIVNYNTFDYTYNGKQIEAKGFITEGGGA